MNRYLAYDSYRSFFTGITLIIDYLSGLSGLVFRHLPTHLRYPYRIRVLTLKEIIAIFYLSQGEEVPVQVRLRADVYTV